MFGERTNNDGHQSAVFCAILALQRLSLTHTVHEENWKIVSTFTVDSLREKLKFGVDVIFDSYES
jgi:hypothetical protein